jgi:hypothetical protein
MYSCLRLASALGRCQAADQSKHSQAEVGVPRAEQRSSKPVVGAPGGAHFEFTRINTTPTFLCKKIEDLRQQGAFIFTEAA